MVGRARNGNHFKPGPLGQIKQTYKELDVCKQTWVQIVNAGK
jgi:hypothetical protein